MHFPALSVYPGVVRYGRRTSNGSPHVRLPNWILLILLGDPESSHFHLYCAKSQRKLSQGIFHIEQVYTLSFNLKTPNIPTWAALGDNSKEKVPLKGRNLKKDWAWDGRPSAQTDPTISIAFRKRWSDIRTDLIQWLVSWTSLSRSDFSSKIMNVFHERLLCVMGK